jgi:hypothetical protein
LRHLATRSERAPGQPDPTLVDQGAATGTVDEGGSVALDLLASPLRGAEEFGRDLLELPNILPGVDYSLGEGRIFGKAQTVTGDLATGIFEFAAAFVPGLGLASKIGKGSRVFNLTRKTQRALTRMGKPVRAAAIDIGRGTVAGAFADFAAFDGHEARLANLINEQFPGLRNPVLDFLAADEEDAEVVGRIKNVLEGASVGFLADALFLGLRGIRSARKARAEQVDLAKKLDEDVPAAEARRVFDDAQDQMRAGTPPPKVDHTFELDDDVLLHDTPERLLMEGDPFVLSRTVKGRAELLRDRLKFTPAMIRRAEELFLERRKKGGALTARQHFRGYVGAGEVRGTVADPRVNPRGLTAEQRALLGIDAKGLNLAHTPGEVDTGFLVRTYEAFFGELPGGIESRLAPVGDEQFIRESLEHLSDIVDGDPNLMGVRFARAAKDAAEAGKKVGRVALALRHMEEIHGGQVVDTLLNGDLDNPTIMTELMARSEEYADALSYIRMGDSEAGRSLRSRQILAAAKDREAIVKAVQEAGGEKNIRRVAEMMRIAAQDGGLQSAAALARLASMTKKQRFWAVTTEYWLNSILSGPRTLTTNLISPMLTSLYRPLEHMLGGAASMNGGAIRQGIREIVGLAEAFRESFTAARAVWGKGGNQILDPRLTKRDDPFAAGAGAFRGLAFGVDEGTALGAFTNWVGRRVRTPSRILATTDEFVKQLNYRAVSRAQLIDQGTQLGLRGGDLAQYVTDNMTQMTLDGQRYSLETVTQRAVKQAAEEGIVDPVAHARRVQEIIADQFDPGLSRIADDAIKRAREVSFTEDLASGTLSSKLQAAVNAHPILRFVVPFIRTPVNIVKFAGRRIPNPMGITEAALNRKMPADAKALEALRSSFAKEVLSGDPERVSDAVGRQAAGMATILFFGTLAAQGRITGRGPTDKEQREALRAAGWQPYSFNIGGKFVSYLRMDPFATMIGTVTDLYDYARMAPVDEQDNISTSVIGLAFAIANNFTNKTYLQGIGDVTAALADPERSMPRVLNQYVGSFVPSALAQAVEVAGDPHIREVNGVLERIRSRVPGFSDTLPPARNLFGEKVSRPRGFALGLENLPGVAGDIMSMISPITYRDVDDNEINVELVRLQHGFSPPVPSRDGVDLMAIRGQGGQPAYDRWLQLHGQVRIGGKTMRQELRRLIHSNIYQRLSPISTSTDESPRVAAIGNVIRQYRAAAFEQLLREFPEVGAAIDHAARTRRAFLAGQTTATSDFGFRVLPVAQPIQPVIGGIGG